MPCFVACDPLMYTAPHYYSRHYARSPCASGLDALFWFVLAFTFLPLLLPTLVFVVSLAIFVLKTLFFACVIGKVASFLCDANDGDGQRCRTDRSTGSGCAKTASSGCPCPMRACFAKMKAMKAACEKERAAVETSTVRDELSRDVSSARATEDAAGTFTVTVAAPGIRPADLSVDVIDRTIRIKGATRRGDEVWRVEREITPPRLVDVATAQCTHADGVLTLTMKRVPTTRVPVVPVVVADTVETPPAPVEEKVAAAEADAAMGEAAASSEGEWDDVKGADEQ